MRVHLAAVLALVVSPAAAQEPAPQGIGFAQAEEGSWYCRHEDPLEALSCAREHCAEADPSQECVPTAWCYPAGWSGLMTVQLPDFHTTMALCGVASEKALTGALTALCAANGDALRCELSLTVDPEGNELPVEGVSFPGGAPPQPEGASPDAPGSEAALSPEAEPAPVPDVAAPEAAGTDVEDSEPAGDLE